MNKHLMNTRLKAHPAPLWKKLLLSLAIISGLAGVVIIVAPPVLSIVTRNILLETGAELVELEDVDFNPFTGRLEIHQLHVNAAGTRVIALEYGHIDIEVWPVIKNKLNIADIELDQGFLYLVQDEDKGIRIKGLDISVASSAPTGSKPPSKWHFGIDKAHIQYSAIKLDTPRLTTIAGFDEVTLATLYSWDRDSLSKLIARGTVNEGSFDIDIQMTPLASLPKYSGSILVNSLVLDRFQPMLQDRLSKLIGVLQLKSDFDITETTPAHWNIRMDSTIESSGLSVAMDELLVESSRIHYSGKPVIDLKLDEQDGIQIAMQGVGTVDISQPLIQASGYRIEGKQFSWSGSKTVHQQPRSELQIELSGEAKIDTLVISHKDDLQLATLNNASARELQFRIPFSLNIGSLELGQGSALRASDPKSSPIATWQAILLGQLALNEDRFSLNSADVNQLSVKLNIDKKGELVLSLPETRTDTVAARKSEKAEKKKPPFQVRIGQLNIGKGSQIDVTDYSLKPTYHGLLVLDQAQMKDIDNTKPDQASQLHIAGTLNKYAPVKIDGKIKPFKDVPDVDLESSLRSIDMTRLSPYSREYAGYDIKTGSMDVDSKLKITDSKINDRMTLMLHKVAIEVTDQEKAAKTDAALTVGLPSALAMMKDSKGNIKLTLPIEGNLNDPQFNFAPAIRSALAKALTQASTAYVAYAIQPYGLALLVSKVAGKMVTHVSFDPLFFEPGSPEPSVTSDDYLEKIGTVMKNRPATELRICGIATTDETKLLPKSEDPEQSLKDLASARSYAIKDILIKRHGIESQRLLTCLPEIDDKAGARPRVEIKM